MKISHWRSQTDENLVSALKDLSREGLNIRFQRANGQLEQVSRIRSVRRDVARVKLVLHQRRAVAAAKAKES